MSLLSIAIVNYKTPRLLRDCLTSLATHCPDAEVIVADNASGDGSADMVRAEFPAVRLIELPENLGFAGANNAALAGAKGDWLLLLNSDTIVVDDSLTRCAAFMAAHPDIGAASPRLVGADGVPQQCLYRFPRLADEWAKARRREVRPDPNEAGWLAGTALMLRRAAIDKVGGLDDGYFMYWEDADLSARLVRGGWRVVAWEGGHIVHYGGASGGGPDAARRSDLFAWYAWGKHRWYYRNRPAREAIGLWFLEAFDVLRKTLRGLLRPSRRSELTHARVLAWVLLLRLTGRRPPRPGSKPPVPTPSAS